MRFLLPANHIENDENPDSSASAFSLGRSCMAEAIAADSLLVPGTLCSTGNRLLRHCPNLAGPSICEEIGPGEAEKLSGIWHLTTCNNPKSKTSCTQGSLKVLLGTECSGDGLPDYAGRCEGMVGNLHESVDVRGKAWNVGPESIQL